MYQVLICDDQEPHRKLIEKMVGRSMMIENLDYQIVLSTSNPNDLLAYLENNAVSSAIYLLDIELDSQINGIQLAGQIRHFDDLGRIIFITSYDHYAPLTFKYKVEAFDFIAKESLDQMQADLSQSLREIHRRDLLGHEEKNKFIIKDLYRTVTIPYDKIIYFTTSNQSHVLHAILTDGIETFYGSLRQIESASETFFRIHQSIVVNLDHIDWVDYQKRRVVMRNGSELPGSIRQLRKLKKVI